MSRTSSHRVPEFGSSISRSNRLDSSVPFEETAIRTSLVAI
jgi:hypothetical protein